MKISIHPPVQDESSILYSRNVNLCNYAENTINLVYLLEREREKKNTAGLHVFKLVYVGVPTLKKKIKKAV